MANEKKTEHGVQSQSTPFYPNIGWGQTLNLAKRKAARRLRKNEMPMHLRDDLTQDSVLKVFQASKNFDPNRGYWWPFASRVMENAEKSFLRHRFAQRRDPRNVLSLNAEIRSKKGGKRKERSELITDSQRYRRLGVDSRSADQINEIRDSVEVLLARLPNSLRSLAEALMTHTPTEVERITGTSRSTIYRRIGRIREEAEKMNLHLFLSV
jgi:RNA polymerase sigma factor (sigma-70 family)